MRIDAEVLSQAEMTLEEWSLIEFRAKRLKLAADLRQIRRNRVGGGTDFGTVSSPIQSPEYGRSRCNSERPRLRVHVDAEGAERGFRKNHGNSIEKSKRSHVQLSTQNSNLSSSPFGGFEHFEGSLSPLTRTGQPAGAIHRQASAPVPATSPTRTQGRGAGADDNDVRTRTLMLRIARPKDSADVKGQTKLIQDVVMAFTRWVRVFK